MSKQVDGTHRGSEKECTTEMYERKSYTTIPPKTTARPMVRVEKKHNAKKFKALVETLRLPICLEVTG